jgi:hypothetical protein
MVAEGAMQVSVGDITARCKECGGTEFKTLGVGSLRLTSRLVCIKCERVTTYLDLLDLIGEEAMRRANDSLAKLKKNGRRKPKPED